jgi:hypothetical protein
MSHISESSLTKIAIFWIRHGVLIDRMPAWQCWLISLSRPQVFLAPKECIASTRSAGRWWQILMLQRAITSSLPMLPANAWDDPNCMHM